MKSLFAATLALFLLAATPAMALVGGPWDNNTYSSEFQMQGTYQGSIRGTNTIGVHIFTVGGNFESFGRAVVYSHGVVYRGWLQANVDMDGGQVFGVMDMLGNITAPETTARSAGFTASGAFDAKIESKGAIVRYSGWGELSFWGIRIQTGDVDTDTSAFNSTSTRTITPPAGDDTSPDINQNSSVTSTDVDFSRIIWQDFADGSRTIRVRVTGTRTSFNFTTYVTTGVVGGQIPTDLDATGAGGGGN